MRIETSISNPSENSTFIKNADTKKAISFIVLLKQKNGSKAFPDLESFAKNAVSKKNILSAAEFEQQYGADAAEMKLVADFFTQKGLKVVDQRLAARAITVSGTVAQINSVFAIELKYFSKNNKVKDATQQASFISYDGYLQIDNSISAYVTAVVGLDNRPLQKNKPTEVKAGDANVKKLGPDFISNPNPPNTKPLSVPQVAKLYNFPQVSASGQTIGLIAIDEGNGAGYNPSDLTAYYNDLRLQGFNLSQPSISSIVHPTYTDAGGVTPYELLPAAWRFGHYPGLELTVDISVASTVAQGAKIVIYYQSHDVRGWYFSLMDMIHPANGAPAPDVISTSIFLVSGDDPTTLAADLGVNGAWFIGLFSSLFRDAALKGITVCCASGDWGAESSQSGTSANVQYPASEPWITTCGGTVIGNINGANFDEYLWMDPPVRGTFATEQGTGGGVSASFPVPFYQSSLNIPKSLLTGGAGRGVPDVAGNASASSGYKIFISNTLNPGNNVVRSGTSYVAPLYAGMAACINSALNMRIGFLNTVLYKNAYAICRDVNPFATNPPLQVTNNNTWIYNNSVPPGDNVGVGYPAGPGWDACTGLGSINGTNLANTVFTTTGAGVPTPVDANTVGVGLMVRYIDSTNMPDSPNAPVTLDFAFIKTSNTASQKVEFNIYSAQSNYQQSVLNVVTPIAAGAVGNWQMLDYDGDGKLDLVFINTSDAVSGVVELIILSGASNYQTKTVNQKTTYRIGDTGTWSLVKNAFTGKYDLVFAKIPSLSDHALNYIQVITLAGSTNYQVVAPPVTSTIHKVSSAQCLLAQYNIGGKIDLVVLETEVVSHYNVGVSVSTGESNYTSTILATPTIFPAGMLSQGNWQMTNYESLIVIPNPLGDSPIHPIHELVSPSLIFIKTKNTVSNKIELFATQSPFNKLMALNLVTQ